MAASRGLNDGLNHALALGLCHDAGSEGQAGSEDKSSECGLEHINIRLKLLQMINVIDCTVSSMNRSVHEPAFGPVVQPQIHAGQLQPALQIDQRFPGQLAQTSGVEPPLG